MPPGKQSREKPPSFGARLGGAAIGGVSAPIAILAWEFELELILTVLVASGLAVAGFMIGPKVWELIVEWL